MFDTATAVLDGARIGINWKRRVLRNEHTITQLGFEKVQKIHSDLAQIKERGAHHNHWDFSVHVCTSVGLSLLVHSTAHNRANFLARLPKIAAPL